MNEIRVRKARLIAAEIRVPGDKHIAHRAVLIASLANGPSVISGFPAAEECMDTVRACISLGARIDYLENAAGDAWSPDHSDTAIGPPCLRVHGTSMRPAPPSGPVDCGHDVTSMALLAGLLSGLPFVSRLNGGAAASRRVAAMVREPLFSMGAALRATGPDKSAPLLITGGFPLQPLQWQEPVATAALKGALVFAGLFASGRSQIPLAAVTCDHTERLLRYYQVKTQTSAGILSVYGGQLPESRDLSIPGDVSYAANWVVAAALQPGSDLVIRDVGLNDSRTGYLRILTRMGAQIREAIESAPGREPSGTLMIRGGPLRGTVIHPREVPALDDELPLIGVAAALAEGTTVIPRTPETSERLNRVAHNLRLMGVKVTSSEQNIAITGTAGEPLQPGCVPSGGDPHVAMGFAIAGLHADGETIVEDTGCVVPAWPEFADDVRKFQGRGISEGRGTPVISSAPFAPSKPRRPA